MAQIQICGDLSRMQVCKSPRTGKTYLRRSQDHSKQSLKEINTIHEVRTKTDGLQNGDFVDDPIWEVMIRAGKQVSFVDVQAPSKSVAERLAIYKAGDHVEILGARRKEKRWVGQGVLKGK